jgi:hypothetical protein
MLISGLFWFLGRIFDKCLLGHKTIATWYSFMSPTLYPSLCSSQIDFSEAVVQRGHHTDAALMDGLLGLARGFGDAGAGGTRDGCGAHGAFHRAISAGLGAADGNAKAVALMDALYALTEDRSARGRERLRALLTRLEQSAQ